MFSINTAPEKFEKATITVHFGFSLFAFEKNSNRKITCLSYRHGFQFEKLCFETVSVNTKERKAGVFKFLWFEKLF